MQTAELLRNAAQALGVTTAKLDEVLQWQRHLVSEQNQLRERVAGLERDREWNGEDRRNVRSRLETGDHTFLRIEQIAKEAERVGKESQRLLREVLQRRTSDGTKVRNKYVELLKVAAPYAWAALAAFGSWLASHFSYTGGH